MSTIEFYKPMSLFTSLISLSPIIVVVVILSWSVLFSNLKGVWYMIALLFSCGFRHWMSSPTPPGPLGPCDNMQYTTRRNTTFSTFVLAFTAVYMMAPMIKNKEVNVQLIVFTAFFFISDIIMKIKTCNALAKDVAMDALGGATASAIVVVSMLSLGIFTKCMFFNEMSSSKEVCSVAKKQTFKCQVRKNGELV
jgi:hypothetical protein